MVHEGLTMVNRANIKKIRYNIINSFIFNSLIKYYLVKNMDEYLYIFDHETRASLNYFHLS